MKNRTRRVEISGQTKPIEGRLTYRMEWREKKNEQLTANPSQYRRDGTTAATTVMKKNLCVQCRMSSIWSRGLVMWHRPFPCCHCTTIWHNCIAGGCPFSKSVHTKWTTNLSTNKLNKGIKEMKEISPEILINLLASRKIVFSPNWFFAKFQYQQPS